MRTRLLLLLLVALTLLGLLAPALARTEPGSSDRIIALSKAAIALVRRDDLQGAVRTLEEALFAARQRAPLEVRRAVLVQTPHTGLGLYEPATGGLVRGRLLRLYVEVANHGHRALTPDASGERHQVDLSVTGTFLFEGEPIGARSLGQHSFTTRSPSGVTSFGLEARLSDKAPAGKYEVVLTVRDATTNREASSRVQFNLQD